MTDSDINVCLETGREHQRVSLLIEYDGRSGRNVNLDCLRVYRKTKEETSVIPARNKDKLEVKNLYFERLILD